MPERVGHERVVNGRPDATVSPDDRGLLLGDGLFETMAFHRGRCPLWDLHMARLEHGCRVLGLPSPSPELLKRECSLLVAEDRRCVIRLTLTRGCGGAGYFPPEPVEVTRVLIRRPFPSGVERLRRDGLRAATSSIRLHDAGSLAGLKHLNRLPQVMIARECAARGPDEALVLDPEGYLVEGLAGNIVIEREDLLIAPGPHPGAVAGVGLEWLRRRAAGDLVEHPMRLGELAPGDALWVLNSVRGLCPVTLLDGRSLAVGHRGRAWQARWRDEIEK